MRPERGQRSKRKSRAAAQARDAHGAWTRRLTQATEDDDVELRRELLELGKEHGWVDANGRVVDTTLTPEQRSHNAMNEDIRAAARGRRFLPLEGERGEA